MTYARRSMQEFAAAGVVDYAILNLLSGGVVVYYTRRLSYTWAVNRPTSPLHLQKFPAYEAAFAAVVALCGEGERPL